MDTSLVYQSMYDLIRKTSTELPEDIHTALKNARLREHPDSIAYSIFDTILESTDLSKTKSLPVCQDTGTILALVKAPQTAIYQEIRACIIQAVRALTKEGILRQNCMDTITETNTGDNTGEHVPGIHFIPENGPARVGIMLKGGGSENVSTQYSLPDDALKAGRDFEGVRKCILDAVFQAQGKGCAPGILGVCIGGDRASGYATAKQQLFRRLDDSHTNKTIALLETTILEQANSMDIGPMGLGGNTTLLGVKIGTAGRHPACYFVTVSYSCWATRRYLIELDDTGAISRWL